MEKRKNFWDKTAGRYARFMHKDAAAYEQFGKEVAHIGEKQKKQHRADCIR